LVVAAALAAPAAAGPKWRLLAGGTATGQGTDALQAYLALTRAGTASFARRVPLEARARLGTIDYSRETLVAVFGGWGCEDHRITVTSAVRRTTTVVVTLIRRPLAPGTVECEALYPTYRLLEITRASLGRPLPTRAEARLVGA
jgi:hypothetical protein